ncbi:MAG: hypothetical protein ABF461_00165 [Zymomonas mobilis subsp. pomaceae]|uniref:hypothetical protein n=1 Tax=Zymomonas mobilis TaxID=542 RepID=UPI0039E9E75D
MISISLIWSFLKGSWRPIACISAIILVIALIHHDGYRRGRRYQKAQYEKAIALVQKQAAKAQQQLNTLANTALQKQQDQAQKIRIIRENVQKVVAQPIYQTLCGNAAATRLLDNARRAANAGLTNQPDDAAPNAASLSAQP